MRLAQDRRGILYWPRAGPLPVQISQHPKRCPVDHVSLQVGSAEIFGLAGESGCGKSTLARMILAEIDGQGWVLVGSLNGGEASAKLNREMCLLVASSEAYEYLADIFWYDWGGPP